MRDIALRSSWVLCIAALASGCSVNPVVPWTVPARTGQPLTNLDYAETYAQTVQGAYKNEISRQAGMSNDLASGLVVAGALALALAAGKASSGTVAGVALIGGTAYAIGNMNLNKQRLLILQAGHEGIGCARRAVIPLRMTDGERRDIEKALMDLDAAGPGLSAPAARVRTSLAAYLQGGALATSELSIRASAALAAAAEVADAAAAASGSGRILVTQARHAGDNLIAAVDKIDAAVIRASLDTMPDLTSVPKVIAGLAGYAAQIAPGAGVDKMISVGLAARNPETLKSGTLPAQAAAHSDLLAATLTLEAVTAGVQGQVRVVQSYLRAYQPGTAALEALKDCGVTDVYFPLKASIDKLAFPGNVDASKGFALSGGTRPYVIELTDTPIQGLTVKGPAPFETRVQVSVTKDVAKPQTTSILVMDSSSPMKTLVVPITIGATAETGKAPVAGNTPVAPTSSGTVQGLVKALNDGFVFSIAQTQVTLGDKAQEKDGVVTVGVKCAPKPGRPFPQTAFRDKLLATIAPDKSLLPLASSLKVLPSNACVSEK